jgi:hypothetical protein
MNYLHVELLTAQSSKHPGTPCGDLVSVERNPVGATFLLTDGLGHGIRANISATFHSSLLLERVRGGASVRQAFADTVAILDHARGTDLPWAALSLAHFLPNGDATILAYEMPSPILIHGRHAQILPMRAIKTESGVLGEIHCVCRPGDSLLLVSDGITQAGLGQKMATISGPVSFQNRRFGNGNGPIPSLANMSNEGWMIDGVLREINLKLAEGMSVTNIAEHIHHKARQHWGREAGDDCTAMLMRCREGITANLFTGPPSTPKKDIQTVREFVQSEGFHIICGASTAQIAARELRRSLDVEQDATSLISPPGYRIAGMDLVTEGAVCLNQLYNIIDAPPEKFEQKNPVTELHTLLSVSDRVRFWVGAAVNPAGESIIFQQQGILHRRQIIPLLAEKLREKGKLVEIHYV